MPDTLDCPCNQRFVHIIRVILNKKENKMNGYIQEEGRVTDHKFTQQRLAVVSGDKIPQDAGLCALYLCAVISPNNETGIV
jgi:hypothetical protein